MYSLKIDVSTAYGGYHWFWQLMGFLYPIGGFIAFLIPLFVCTEQDPDNPLIDDAFDILDRSGVGVSIEMKNRQRRQEALEKS